MKRFTGALAFALAAGLIGTAAAQDAVKDSPYYPLQVGNTWTYQTMGGTIIMKVAAHEKTNGEPTAKIETIVNDKVVASEHVAVKEDGIYRYSINDQKPDEPVRFLKLPPKAGDTWDVDTKIQDQAIKGKFTLKEEKVKVGGKDYNTVVAEGKDFQIAGQKTSIKYWFAEGVGIVKLSFSLDGQEAVLELQKFEAAGKEAKEPKDAKETKP